MLMLLAFASTSVAFAKDFEKEELTFGFIKLTDNAPLIIAKEKGFFEDEGLSVTLQAQANWKILLDRVIGGELDGGMRGNRGDEPAGRTQGIRRREVIH